MTTTASSGSEFVDPLERVQAYQLAREAARRARADAESLEASLITREVSSQLLRAAGSISANIAEGYSRGTVPERRKFFEYALGSARECIVWYETSNHQAREERTARLVSIRRLLLTMIRTCRESVARDTRGFSK